jgi:hypothetical protein
MEHLGHKIELAFYGRQDSPESVTLECTDCCEVLVAFEDLEDPADLDDLDNMEPY